MSSLTSGHLDTYFSVPWNKGDWIARVNAEGEQLNKRHIIEIYKLFSDPEEMPELMLSLH